jgi:hypothetical protein
MLIKTKTTLAAMLLISSASLAGAAYDGDGNFVPSAHQQDVIIRHAPAAFANTFAASPTVRAPSMEWDGDGNPVRLGR